MKNEKIDPLKKFPTKNLGIKNRVSVDINYDTDERYTSDVVFKCGLNGEKEQIPEFNRLSINTRRIDSPDPDSQTPQIYFLNSPKKKYNFSMQKIKSKGILLYYNE